jgi:LEA14-like dessication related protein
MLKKILLAVLVLAFAIIAAFFVWRYRGYARDKDPAKTFLLPGVKLLDVNITSLTSRKTEMTVKVLIKNEMPVSFTADSLQYQVFINATEVMRDHYKKSITVKSNGSSWISLPITVFTHDLISVLKNNEKENIDSAEYLFKISFFSNILFKVHFHKEFRRFLPLVHIPEVKAEHIEIRSLKFSGAILDVKLSVKNQNVFPLMVKNIAYEFFIEGNEWVKGTIPGVTDIQPKSIAELTLPITLSFKEVRRTLFDLLKKGEKVNYKLHLTVTLDSDKSKLKNTRVVLESEGSVKSLMKFIKNK